jgi:hypothetical protein
MYTKKSFKKLSKYTDFLLVKIVLFMKNKTHSQNTIAEDIFKFDTLKNIKVHLF